MKAVAIYLDWPERYTFFRRMVRGLRELGWGIIFFTNKVTLHVRARRDGFPSVLLRRSTARNAVDLEGCRERIAGTLTVGESLRLYASATTALERLAEMGSLEAILVWNGSDIVGQAVKNFAAQGGLPILFLEIGNLPGKLFVDPKGVNAQSVLAKSEAVLDRYPADLAAFGEWRAEYLSSKLEHHAVPQAKLLDQVSYLSTGINWCGFKMLGVPTDDNTSLLEKVIWRIQRRKGLRQENVNLTATEYVFFPMQVSNDSQVVLNSEVDNEGAIQYASKEAKRLGYRLLVKPHPAEVNVRLLDRIVSLKDELNFSLVQDNIFQLLRHAQRVITINSTAGLEALLLGKSVEFLGETFYRYLNTNQRMAQYVTGYLLDIDYFDREDIPTRKVDQLMGRLHDFFT